MMMNTLQTTRMRFIFRKLWITAICGLCQINELTYPFELIKIIVESCMCNTLFIKIMQNINYYDHMRLFYLKNIDLYYWYYLFMMCIFCARIKFIGLNAITFTSILSITINNIINKSYIILSNKHYLCDSKHFYSYYYHFCIILWTFNNL